MLKEKMLIALGEFWHLSWVLTLIIAGISILVGFMRFYLPQEKIQKKFRNQNTVIGAFSGAALGILTPFCSASMVPVAMGMIEMSAPFSTVLPFFISAPLCNFVVIGLIVSAFGWKVGLFYFLWTFCCAIVAGLTIGRSRARYQVKNLSEMLKEKGKKESETMCCSATDSESCCTDVPITEPTCFAASSCASGQEQTAGADCCAVANTGESHREKIQWAFQFAWALFKKIMPYVLIGAVISGLALAFVPNNIVERYVGTNSWYAIPIAAAISIPLYLRIEMAIPLLITLLGKGMGMGAAIALLISGTGASLPEFAILSSMLKPKGVIVFALTIFTMATIGGFLFMLLGSFLILF